MIVVLVSRSWGPKRESEGSSESMGRACIWIQIVPASTVSPLPLGERLPSGLTRGSTHPDRRVRAVRAQAPRRVRGFVLSIDPNPSPQPSPKAPKGRGSALPSPLGACLNSRCSLLGERGSTFGYEQVFSPLEY